jgi:hypothetical protein
VGHVDDDPEPIACTHDRGAEIRQTTLHRVFGLDVAQFIRSVVNQLQMTHAMGDTHLLDALDLPSRKSAPSAATMMDGPPVGAAQHCGIPNEVQLLLLCKPQQPNKNCLAPGVKFARFGRTNRMNAPIWKDAMG